MPKEQAGTASGTMAAKSQLSSAQQFAQKKTSIQWRSNNEF